MLHIMQCTVFFLTPQLHVTVADMFSVKVVGVFAEEEAGGSATAAAPLRVCVGNAVPFRANIPALRVKQRCDPDH